MKTMTWTSFWIVADVGILATTTVLVTLTLVVAFHVKDMYDERELSREAEEFLRKESDGSG